MEECGRRMHGGVCLPCLRDRLGLQAERGLSLVPVPGQRLRRESVRQHPARRSVRDGEDIPDATSSTYMANDGGEHSYNPTQENRIAFGLAGRLPRDRRWGDHTSKKTVSNEVQD